MVLPQLAKDQCHSCLDYKVNWRATFYNHSRLFIHDLIPFAFTRRSHQWHPKSLAKPDHISCSRCPFQAVFLKLVRGTLMIARVCLVLRLVHHLSLNVFVLVHSFVRVLSRCLFQAVLLSYRESQVLLVRVEIQGSLCELEPHDITSRRSYLPILQITRLKKFMTPGGFFTPISFPKDESLDSFASITAVLLLLSIVLFLLYVGARYVRCPRQAGAPDTYAEAELVRLP